MLSCEYLGRRHQHRLPAVLHRKKHSRRGAHRLSASDVADDHSAHGRVARHIAPDLAYHPALRARERVRQNALKRSQIRLCAGKCGRTSALGSRHRNSEREVEELVEYKSLFSRRKSDEALGHMNIAHRVRERAKLVSLSYILGKRIRLSHRSRKRHRRAHVLGYLLLSDALGQRIDRHERQKLLALDVGLVCRRGHSVSARTLLYLSVKAEGRAEREHALEVILIKKGYLAGGTVVINAEFGKRHSSLHSDAPRLCRHRQQMRAFRLAVRVDKKLHVASVLISARIVAEQISYAAYSERRIVRCPRRANAVKLFDIGIEYCHVALLQNSN